ncbi:SusE domain-containing protein [Sphingobacterium corticis]|uniref:SusE domain-containing protein n=1 Tax=Sphingobacterium corticis TaxID=1812823 RepID=A0ABW5NPN8_9SPHI
MRFTPYLAVAIASMAIFSACEKDSEMVTVNIGELPTLTASTDSLILLQENAADTAVIFNWSPLDVNWSNNEVSTNILTYAVQISTKERNFQGAPILTIDAQGTTAAATVQQLNTAMIEAKLPLEEQSNLVARLALTLAPNKVQYSNVLELKVTPYEDVVMLPSLFIAGALNNWVHSNDFRVGSINSDTKYEGYANFTAGNLAFKFSSQANWGGTNYGGTTGKLSNAGNADNLEVPAGGYYLLKADTEALTWTATPVTWGIIGAAAKGWGDNDDVALTYDEKENVWTATVDFSAGPFKFRANKAWTISFGAGARAGVLSYGGGDLQITEAGRYLVTLDLRNAGYYTYTIEAQ